MLFGWKKTAAAKSDAKQNGLVPLLAPNYSKELSRSQEPERPAVRFENVSLGTQIQNLNYEIPSGAWLLLMGPDSLTKALFCDLSFGFVKPQNGQVEPLFQGSDVSFLGRSNTTYGVSLLDHLTSGVKERSRGLLEFVVEKVFGPNLRKLLDTSSLLRTKEDQALLDLNLNERDFLELAEANLLLQNRPAVIIDASSDFYRTALEQGFRHSELLLRSGKTFFWIVDDSFPLDKGVAPWLLHKDIPQLSLYFAPEALLKHIN